MKYLVDTSALVRVLRNQVDEQWHELADRGLIAICEPVLAETLVIAGARRYERVETSLRAMYPLVPLPEKVWDIVTATRRELAKVSAHGGLSVADHLVAATGIALKLTVLHEDADFETAARLVPRLRQHRISEPPKE